MAKFRNVHNDHETTNGSGAAWLWCLLFGPLYFIAKGNWRMFFIGLILSMFTLGLSWLVFPFFVYRLNRNQLLMTGYKEIKA